MDTILTCQFHAGSKSQNVTEPQVHSLTNQANLLSFDPIIPDGSNLPFHSTDKLCTNHSTIKL